MHVNKELTNGSKTLPKGAKTKGYKGIAMEGFVARWYAKNQRKTPEQYRTWAEMVAEDVAEDSSVLEVDQVPVIWQ